VFASSQVENFALVLEMYLTRQENQITSSIDFCADVKFETLN